MKKFILNCVIFLAGFIGTLGWSIICTSTNEGIGGLVSNATPIDWIIIIAFALISLYGLISAIKDVKKEK